LLMTKQKTPGPFPMSSNLLWSGKHTNKCIIFSFTVIQ